MFLYQILIKTYGLFLLGLSPFLAKAYLWVNGRKGLFKTLPNGKTHKIFWVHCASLGEYEQAIPIIRSIKNQFSEYKCFLTFFSPSGYINTKPNQLVDFISYLPLDTKKNSKHFLELAQPQFAIFIKNDFWPNYLNQLIRKKIPVFIVTAQFRKNHFLFKPYGKWLLDILSKSNHIFVQDQCSKDLLQNHKIKQVSICGDSRYQRVKENLEQKKEIPLIKDFILNQKVIIGGSTYLKDSKMLINICQKQSEWKLILAPHQIEISSELQKYGLLYSKATKQNIVQASVLIIDSIGLLAQLYQYGHVAYIGGGFGKKGLHNILEAIIFGCPVMFGHNYFKFTEAQEAIDHSIAKSIGSEKELKDAINYFLKLNLDKSIVSNFCQKRYYSNKSIVEVIQKSLK